MEQWNRSPLCLPGQYYTQSLTTGNQTFFIKIAKYRSQKIIRAIFGEKLGEETEPISRQLGSAVTDVGL